MPATRLIALAAFVLLGLWDVWEAVGNLIGLPPYYEVLGIAEATPWWLLVLGLVFALAALIIGVTLALRARQPGALVLVLLLVLASHAALSASVLAVEQAWRAHHVTELVTAELGLD